ncbi:MAG: hypothetical protein IJQ53_01730 [Clostridia bacterium]|nr:hypothetical protein [Clostridia bacterium]
MKKPFVVLLKNKKAAFAAAVLLTVFALYLLFSPGGSVPAFASGEGGSFRRGVFDLVRGMVS